MQRSKYRGHGLDIHALPPGSTVVVETDGSRYRFVVLFDSSTVLVKGGSIFPAETIVRFVGATAAGGVAMVGWILVGWRIELHLDSVCIRSSPVRAVKVEGVPPRQLTRAVS